mmetsp:Transcript_144481/g.402506  ORF Transcript_144481/g.402506 Transcript_144481/m.402506 type:complete len:631 (+) Transcript_144481:37-1929(+)
MYITILFLRGGPQFGTPQLMRLFAALALTSLLVPPAGATALPATGEGWAGGGRPPGGASQCPASDMAHTGAACALQHGAVFSGTRLEEVPDLALRDEALHESLLRKDQRAPSRRPLQAIRAGKMDATGLVDAPRDTAVAAGRVCSSIRADVPSGISAALMLVALVLLKVSVNRSDKASAARTVYLVVHFIFFMNYTVVILDSVDLCIKVGMNEGGSGRMVGMYMLGFCTGCSAMWLLVRQRSMYGLWRERPRTVLLCGGLLCELIGSAAYTFVAHRATCAGHEPIPAPAQDLLASLLVVSRFVSGFGFGSSLQFYVWGMLHLTPVIDRGNLAANRIFLGMLATGLGPVIAAFVQEVEPCTDGPHLDIVGHVQIIGALGSIVAVIWCHPDDLRDCEDYMEYTSDVAHEPTDAKLGHRRWIVVGCLCMSGLRSFGIAAIDVVVTMLLEEQYHWDQRVTGLTIGAIFLLCIPLKFLHAMAAHLMSVVAWIRLLCFVAVLGTLMLFTSIGKALLFHSGGAAQLIVAGGVIFPTFYLSDALSTGLLHQHVLPEGSLLDGNHAQLWYNVLAGISRFIAPWQARTEVRLCGQKDWFAAQQLGITCLFLLAFECLVQPFLKKAGVLEQREDTEEQVSK